MLAPLLCLLGLTLVGQDGSPVPVGSVVRAPGVWTVEQTPIAEEAKVCAEILCWSYR